MPGVPGAVGSGPIDIFRGVIGCKGIEDFVIGGDLGKMSSCMIDDVIIGGGGDGESLRASSAAAAAASAAAAAAAALAAAFREALLGALLALRVFRPGAMMMAFYVTQKAFIKEVFKNFSDKFVFVRTHSFFRPEDEQFCHAL